MSSPGSITSARNRPFKPTFYHGSLLSERFPHLREKVSASMRRRSTDVGATSNRDRLVAQYLR